MDLTWVGNSVALVTGSATGIGRAVAWRFASLGYAVTINYSKSRTEAGSNRRGAYVKRGGEAAPWSRPTSPTIRPSAMVERTAEEFGGLDVLVNNAATTFFVAHHDLEGLTDQVWDEILDVNLKGTFFACRAAMPYLRSRKGNIVNIASVAGGGGVGELDRLRREQGRGHHHDQEPGQGVCPEVRVNAVAPGPVQTRWLADHQDMVEQAMKSTPLKRPASADDIADVTLFLANGTSLMTGQVLVADGGRTI